MSSTKFWKPIYQLFKPEEPLTTLEDIRDFYVQRNDSPVENLISALEMEDDPAKFLLSGHTGSGKTTELHRVKHSLSDNYTVIWIDTATALDRYNIGYAEVVVLIGQEVCRQAIKPGWWSRKDDRLLKGLEDSLRTIIYQDKRDTVESLGLPELLNKMGIVLKQGLTREMTRSLNIRPVLSEIISRVNDIIKAAEQDRQQKLLVIVDGLDRHDQVTALEMFASPLLTELECHIIYTIPIFLRYSSSFRQPLQRFQECLDLKNLAVFECDRNLSPTTAPNPIGRDTLITVVQKRLQRLRDKSGYKPEDLFTNDALELLCEKSGGVMRDLIRLSRTACQIAVKYQLICVNQQVAEEAVKEERKAYTISDYHFPELAKVHQTGRLTTNTHNLPDKGEFVICDELLQNKFVLGYYDQNKNSWFDVNPILIEDLERWQSANYLGDYSS